MSEIMQDERGFTLIELMIVIVIISILASTAVPKYASNINKARLTADIANAKVIHQAIVLYSLVHSVPPEKFSDLDEFVGKVVSAQLIDGKSITVDDDHPGSPIFDIHLDTGTVIIYDTHGIQQAQF